VKDIGIGENDLMVEPAMHQDISPSKLCFRPYLIKVLRIKTRRLQIWAIPTKFGLFELVLLIADELIGGIHGH
jgi:hypothetical protein